MKKKTSFNISDETSQNLDILVHKYRLGSRNNAVEFCVKQVIKALPALTKELKKRLGDKS